MQCILFFLAYDFSLQQAWISFLFFISFRFKLIKSSVCEVESDKQAQQPLYTISSNVFESVKKSTKQNHKTTIISALAIISLILFFDLRGFIIICLI